MCLILWAGVCLASSVWLVLGPIFGLSGSLCLHQELAEWLEAMATLAFWARPPSGVLHPGSCLTWVYILQSPGVDKFLAHNHAYKVLGFPVPCTILDFFSNWPQFSCLGCAIAGHTSRGWHSLTIILDLNCYFDSIPSGGSKVFWASGLICTKSWTSQYLGCQWGLPANLAGESSCSFLSLSSYPLCFLIIPSQV